jgi:hypothetical protein
MPFFGHIFEQNFGHIFGPSQGDVVILFLVNPFNPVPLFDDPKFSDEVFSHFKELRFFYDYYNNRSLEVLRRLSIFKSSFHSNSPPHIW